jgi:CHAT domain-containing protein
MAMGRYREALEYIPDNSSGMKIVVSFVNGLGPYAYRGDSTTTVIEVPRLVMRGKALEETGKFDEAAAAFDEVLATPRIKDMGDLYWIALFERGRINEAAGRPEPATALYRQAVDVIELQRSTIKTEAAKIGFVGDKQAAYGRLVAGLIRQGRAAEAFEYVERAKARALVDMLAAKQDFDTHGADTEQVRQVLAQLDGADVGDHSPGRGTEPYAAESGGTRNLALARTQLQAAAPELATLVTVSAVPSDELKALVGPDEALVEYYGQDQDFYVFVLDRQKLQVARVDASGLDQRVRDWRAAIQQIDDGAWLGRAQTLYAQLWQPVADRITARKIILVPHGALHYLPFAALVAPDGGFLGDRYAMRLLPSASVLKFLRPASPSGRAPLLALGDPDLGDPRYDLRFAEEEARTVAGIVPGSRVLLRKDASKANFKAAHGAFARIHFATHGEFNADQPLASGLHLAKDGGGDDLLKVSELYSMKLNADLVTLSACETGLGKVANGDDVVGLTRGFLYAGASSIVASLWSVDDKATALLMETFYRNLSTMNKEEALRQAQATTRKSFPQPFFWAAFQLTGRGD